MRTNRKERLSGLIKEKISEIMMHVLDEFSGFLISFTDVKVAKDFMNVTIFYSIFGNEDDRKRLEKLFMKYKSRIRFELGNRINFRMVPNFHFKYDETMEKASRIENLLQGMKLDE